MGEEIIDLLIVYFRGGENAYRLFRVGMFNNLGAFDYFDTDDFKQRVGEDYEVTKTDSRIEISGKRNDELIWSELEEYHKDLGLKVEIDIVE